MRTPRMIARRRPRALSTLRAILMIGSAAWDAMSATGTATATMTHAASVLNSAARHFAMTRARSSTGRVAMNGVIPYDAEAFALDLPAVAATKMAMNGGSRSEAATISMTMTAVS